MTTSKVKTFLHSNQKLRMIKITFGLLLSVLGFTCMFLPGKASAHQAALGVHGGLNIATACVNPEALDPQPVFDSLLALWCEMRLM